MKYFIRVAMLCMALDPLTAVADTPTQELRLPGLRPAQKDTRALQQRLMAENRAQMMQAVQHEGRTLVQAQKAQQFQFFKLTELGRSPSGAGLRIAYLAQHPDDRFECGTIQWAEGAIWPELARQLFSPTIPAQADAAENLRNMGCLK